jgi:hypothetical protein
MESMMTAPAPVVGEVAGIDVAPLAWALERMTPELWEVVPGESPAEREARRLAAADILDDLLGEFASESEADR